MPEFSDKCEANPRCVRAEQIRYPLPCSTSTTPAASSASGARTHSPRTGAETRLTRTPGTTGAVRAIM
ncbi:MAG TPA: hypothetical protein VE400_07610 [Mycobacterium sp.]|nr:hypothetical protein [Mycobacterium sp.]